MSTLSYIQHFCSKHRLALRELSVADSDMGGVEGYFRAYRENYRGKAEGEADALGQVGRGTDLGVKGGRRELL